MTHDTLVHVYVHAIIRLGESGSTDRFGYAGVGDDVQMSSKITTHTH